MASYALSVNSRKHGCKVIILRRQASGSYVSAINPQLHKVSSVSGCVTRPGRTFRVLRVEIGPTVWLSEIFLLQKSPVVRLGSTNSSDCFTNIPYHIVSLHLRMQMEGKLLQHVQINSGGRSNRNSRGAGWLLLTEGAKRQPSIASSCEEIQRAFESQRHM